MKRVLAVMVLTVCVHGGTSFAGEQQGWKTFETRCAECHAVEAPDPDKRDLARIWDRKGPDLYHAGDKFKPEWLRNWLQKPSRIRPGGVLYSRNVTRQSDGDTLNTDALPSHPAVTAEEAEDLVTALMTLHAPEGYIKSGVFDKNKKSNARMGRMFFTKLRGCAACHTDKPGHGGLSGPTLHNAGERLQADYVYSYTKNPQRFDPMVWMPALELSDKDMQRLTAYVMSLHGEDK